MNHHCSNSWRRPLSMAAATLCAASFGLWAPLAGADNQTPGNPPTYATDLTNIAAADNGGHVVSFSSVYENDQTYKADNVIDGKTYNSKDNTGTKGWVSNRFDPVDMDYITLGFANNTTHRIGKIVIDPSTEGTPGRWSRHIQVLVSTDTAEGPFRVVAELTLRQAAEKQEFTILPTDARFVRFNVRTNWGSDRAVGIGEIEIYETISDKDALGQLISRYEGTLNELRRYRQTQIESVNGGAPTNATPNTPAKPASLSNGLSNDARSLLQFVQLSNTTGGTAAGDELPISSVNIAAAKNGGKVVAYSSLYRADAKYSPENLIDGQVFDAASNKGSAGWASEGFQPGQQYVTLGFAEDRTRLIGKITVNPSTPALPDRWARRIEVQATTVSAKDGPWKTVTTLNLRNEATYQEFTVRPFEAKYLRFVFTANGPGDINFAGTDPDVNSDRAVALGEIQVYEAVATGDALDAVIGRFGQILVDLKTLRRLQANAADGATTTPAAAPASTTPATPQQTSLEAARPVIITGLGKATS